MSWWRCSARRPGQRVSARHPTPATGHRAVQEPRAERVRCSRRGQRVPGGSTADADRRSGTQRQPAAVRARPAMTKHRRAHARIDVSVRPWAQANRALSLAHIEGTPRSGIWAGSVKPSRSKAPRSVRPSMDGRSMGVAWWHMTRSRSTLSGVAAPIRDAAASGVIGALSIVGPKFRLTDDVCAEHGAILVRHFRALSEGLGGVWAGTKPATYPNDWAAAEERTGLALA